MTATKFSPRLKTAARQYCISFIDAVRYCFIEEFIYRLTQSGYANKLVLRGGLLVDILTDNICTDSNIDFLYLDAPSDITEGFIRDIIEDIIYNSGERLPVNFVLKDVQANDSKRTYNGYSALISAELEELRLSLKIKIGIDDILFHETEKTELINILLADETTECTAYPVESIIAEKLDIILCRFELNRCMQHLYDIFLLSQTFDFDGYELQRAVRATLQNRKNDCDEERINQIFMSHNDEDMQLSWQHFARVFEIDEEYYSVLQRTVRFIEPIWNNINSERRFSKEWSAVSGEWKEPMYLY